MKRRCFFLLDSLAVGGSEQKTIRAANLLVEQGYNVHLGALNASQDLRGELDNRIPVFSGNRAGKFDVRLLWDIRRYLIEHKIDVVWAVNLYPLLYLFLATLLCRRNIRVIGSTNITVFRNDYENRKMNIYGPIIRRLDAFVFGSQQQQLIWEEKYKLSGPELYVLHNGVDVDWFSSSEGRLGRDSARSCYSFDRGDIVVGMVAQFRSEKAHCDLVEACSRLRVNGFPVKLLLVGSGSERKNIADMAERMGLAEHVIFAGQLDDVRPALSAMDIFALTSRSVETFSNAALEAMSMGLPAVLSDLSGASEMVIDGENGFLYPPANVELLATVLQYLMDSATRNRLGLNARRLVEQRFSVDAMARKYSAVIDGSGSG